MRITTRLRIISGMSLTALVILVPVLVASFVEFRSARSDYDLAGRIKLNYFERSSLRSQYFLYREERTVGQWKQNMEEAERLLRQAAQQFTRDQDREVVERINVNLEASAAIFQRIVGNTATLKEGAGPRPIYDELDKRLTSQLLLKAAAIRDATTALQEGCAQRVEQNYKRLAIIIGLLSVTLALSSILTAAQLSRLIRKRVQPLHEGARVIANGDFDYRIKSVNSDEFSEIAGSINAMTDRLQAFTRKLEAEIEEHRVAQEALQEEELRYHTVADFTYDWEYWMLPDGSLRYVSPSCEQISGYTRDEFYADPELMTRIVHPDDQLRYAGQSYYPSTRHAPLPLDYRIRTRGGEIRWISRTCQPVFDPDGKALGIRASNRDITDRKQMEDQVRQLAFHDLLTQLPNRRLLNDRLSQAMAASKRSACFGALIFLDLDNFKPLNDAHGHDVGDLLLIEVADRLKKCVRERDTVARFGGDEFVVMISELDRDQRESEAEVGIIAEKIRASLSKPYRLRVKRDGEADATIEHHCTSSIGVALFIGHKASENDILKRADRAMYKAKEAGRNAIRFYAQA